MEHIFSRTEMLKGSEFLERLKNSKVAVFGVGGVGGYVCEALVRAGVGEFDLIDKDVVSVSNINRQIIALHSTLGRYKTEVMKERMLDINPEVKVNIHNRFFLPENASDFDFASYDYIVDAVDTVTAKLELIMRAKEHNVPIISAMGAGNKLDPGRFRVADIYDTEVCPLAKVMRRELKKRGVKKLKVVFSNELPSVPRMDAKEIGNCSQQISGNLFEEKITARVKISPGSISFVPATVGLLMASEIVKDLENIKNQDF